MNARRFFLDVGPGESRAVVTLGGKPERLLIARDSDIPVQRLGAIVLGRVASVLPDQSLAFIDLGAGPMGALNFGPGERPPVEGSMIEVEVKSEARADKGPVVRWVGPGEGGVGLRLAGPDLPTRLNVLAREARIETGAGARVVADLACEEVLATEFPLPGGGSISVERTRALTAVDIDLGGRRGGGAKRASRAANLGGIAEAARVLRLKGLGGLIVIDLAGWGHDSPALLAAARAAFRPDNPGVSIGGVSRFGVIELTVPRRLRPALERLAGRHGEPTPEAVAFAMLRRLEAEAQLDGGGRFEGLAGAEAVDAASSFLMALNGRLGGRLSVRGEAGRQGFEVMRR